MHFLGHPSVVCASCLAYPQELSRPNDSKEAYRTYTHLLDASNAPPDHSLSDFFDTDSFFGKTTASLEVASDLLPKTQSCFDSTLPATSITAPNTTATAKSALQQAPNLTPFGLLDQISCGRSTDPLGELACILPDNDCLCTPSLCSDATEATVSPRILKHQPLPPSIEHKEEPTSKRPRRKRGRPRLDCSDEAEPLSTSSGRSCKQRRSRIPHNQVERKYREGLNLELERLRQAVSTLPQSGEGDAIGQPKPSKAVVITAAVNYIKRIKKERHALQEENERIRYAQGRRRQKMFNDLVTG
ncbi:uncharacterized protein ALTATR162_LOCUS6996 [Alternaria atra]|uniref:BHLH domain-containing protein n=1 Tax=Alternaria atra TaxID=119953 RepID=A0A8J2I3P4_9PLEO|nr:uncharacterized protein ALTATR162_LOCUS6996 [Alternaria atra]CAG5169083.1 unnamed protein product [Alternaria atra]